MADHWTIKLETIFTDYLSTISTATIPATVQKVASRSTAARTRPCLVVEADGDRAGNYFVDANITLHVLTNADDTTDAQAATWSKAAADFVRDESAWAAWTATKTTTYRTGWAVRKKWLGAFDVETDEDAHTRDTKQTISLAVEID
tara:strand:- start:114 stop:551 length:438 start_codon:yes stop_codon:yes gene_type:complete